SNPDELESARSKYKLPDNFALYVGDVNWNKNLHGLLNAISISKIQLVLVGSALTDQNLPQVKELDALIKELDLGSLITKTGFVPEKDLVVLYNLAGVVVMPSFYEGFGLPVLEGMACGTPVVCSKNSSLEEIGGDVAIFCDPSDPKDISLKIA